MSGYVVCRSSRRVRAVSLALALVFGAAGVASGGVYLGPYLKSDGTAYIDTGIIAETNMVADYWVYFGGNRNHTGVFVGAYGSATDSRLNLGGHSANKGLFVANGTCPNGNYDASFFNQRWYHVVVTASVDVLTASADGIACGPYTMPNPKPAGISLYCFANNFRGKADSIMQSGSCIGALKLWKNGTLVRDFSAAKDDSGTVGFRDAVSGEFFAPLAGTFTYGAGLTGNEVALATADAAAGATTSFNSAGGWTGGAAPDADHDYIVALGESEGLWLPTASASFAGNALQIGTETTAGRMDVSSSGLTYTAPFILKNGLLNVTANLTTTLSGAIRVLSTEAKPFVIQGAAGTVYIHSFDASVLGDATAVIVLKGTGTKQALCLTGSSWSSLPFSQYCGKIVVDAAKLRVSNLSLGHRVFTKDAITIRNGGAMTCNASVPTWNVPNAGIWIEDTGGSFWSEYNSVKCYQTIQGGPFTVSGDMSFFGTMRVSSLTVAGATFSIRSAATLDVSEINVTGGTLTFESGVTCVNETKTAVTVKTGMNSQGKTTTGVLQLDNFPSDHADLTLDGGELKMGAASGIVPLTNLVYKSGSVTLTFDSTAGEPQCLRLCGTVTGISTSNRLKLKGAAWPSAVATGKYPILRVEKTAVSSFSADMLDISGFVYDDPTYEISLKVEEDGDDYVASFSRKFAVGIELVQGDTGFAATTAFNGNGAQWSDGEAPHETLYTVALGTNAGCALHCPDANATFAGTKLSIGTEETPGWLVVGKKHDYTFTRLSLNNGMLSVSNNVEAGMLGPITIATTEENPFVLEGKGTFRFGNVVGDETARFVVRGITVYAGQSWGNGGFANFAGEMVYDGASLCYGTLSTAIAKDTPRAVTLRNGACLAFTSAGTTMSKPTFGIAVEGEKCTLQNWYGGQTLKMNVNLHGDTITVLHDAANNSGRIALSKLAVKRRNQNGQGSFSLNAGSYLSVTNYLADDGRLIFNGGLTFDPDLAVSGLTVTNGALVRANADAMAHLSLQLEAGGTFAVTNDDGVLCQALVTTNAHLAGGATLKLDVDPLAKTCDSLELTGDSLFDATRENPLNIVVNPLSLLGDAQPPDGISRTFALLTLPEKAGNFSKRAFNVTFTQPSLLDGMKLYVRKNPDGRRSLVLSDTGNGLSVIVW